MWGKHASHISAAVSSLLEHSFLSGEPMGKLGLGLPEGTVPEGREKWVEPVSSHSAGAVH